MSKFKSLNYPDTAEGAIQCLADESTLETTGAKAEADPWVEGVWKVTMASGDAAIVYLKGYGNQLHSEFNDFEEFF